MLRYIKTRFVFFLLFLLPRSIREFVFALSAAQRATGERVLETVTIRAADVAVFATVNGRARFATPDVTAVEGNLYTDPEAARAAILKEA